MAWDPDLYLRFRAERAAPFEDLLGFVRAAPGLSVLDLGCGTGELTARLKGALPDSDVLGLDSSPAMLERARALARPGLRFELGSVEAAGGEYDLVFSNAALHWVAGHRDLLPRLLGMVRPGGQLAVQIPSNHDHPANRAGDEVALRHPFREALGAWTRTVHVLPLPEYAEILYSAGAEDLTALEKVYPHLLADAGALRDWLAGTTLRPYLSRLSEPLREPFLKAVGEELGRRFPGSPVFFGFRRILLHARRRKEER
ncbi:MAG: methyltransferase domain-containing protein [Acidobacteriota bacterium]